MFDARAFFERVLVALNDARHRDVARAVPPGLRHRHRRSRASGRSVSSVPAWRASSIPAACHEVNVDDSRSIGRRRALGDHAVVHGRSAVAPDELHGRSCGFATRTAHGGTSILLVELRDEKLCRAWKRSTRPSCRRRWPSRSPPAPRG